MVFGESRLRSSAPVGIQSTELREALHIQVAERDFKLSLDCARWPEEIDPPPGWIEGPGCLHRKIIETPEEEKKYGKQLAGPIKESILRFPSAPIHGLHRLHEYHVSRGPSENLHTYRVLASTVRPRRVQRVFLLHNGLNETQSMGLYYRLASHLIYRYPGTICLLRPFPGHLTRSRFHRFAETPLDQYLWDGSHLFRQFLRYMIETQWLLSVITRRSIYRCISGLNLLAEGEDRRSSRLDHDYLASEIGRAWHQLHKASKAAVREQRRSQDDAIPVRPAPEDAPFRQAVESLRGLLRLEDELDGEFNARLKERPSVHVIGYSLGGFTAQSVFMSWPFLVSSCSTLLSGGALRELAPTAFADPEEWQTVLHSLRYELDDAMINNRYMRRGKRVSGIDLDLFLSLKSTFYEVFQQEYRGSFQTRLAAFRRRMLFVVGGNDPIVRPQTVLDSGPPGGINMLAIGGLGHFLEARARDHEEDEQRTFWMPEIAGLIGALADEATTKQHQERAENWLDADMRRPERPSKDGAAPLSVAERLAIKGDGALPGPLFQRCLDDLLSRVSKKEGVLFVLRNEIPTVLLDEDAIQDHAAALHHAEPGIADYIDGVRGRYEEIVAGDNRERFCVILPWNARAILKGMDADLGHPSQSEGTGGQMPTRSTPAATWKGFKKTRAKLADKAHPDVIRVCEGQQSVDAGGLPELDTEGLVLAARKRLHTEEENPITPSLPDCWVWMSREFFGLDKNEGLSVRKARELLCKSLPELSEDRLANRLSDDHLRMVTVSRARYNPRFRGRIVADPKAAGDLLLHVALCIAASVPLKDYDLDRGCLRESAVSGSQQ